jgi:hypothetical protein
MLGIVPVDGNRDQLAVLVAFDHFGHDDGGQGARHMDLAPLALDDAFALQLPQHLFQRDAVLPVEPEGARDLAFADIIAMLGNEGDQRLLGRHALR